MLSYSLLSAKCKSVSSILLHRDTPSIGRHRDWACPPGYSAVGHNSYSGPPHDTGKPVRGPRKLLFRF